MSTLIRAARAMTIVCLSAVIGFGQSPTATADPTGTQSNNDKLLGLLSGGYIPAECQASKPIPGDPFLARQGCGPNDLPGGPSSAIYSLYGSVADLNNSFNVAVNSGTPVPCPGTTGPGPIAWQGGMVLCATSNQESDTGAPFMAWTRNADLLMVSAKPKGRDLAPLYAWWLTAR
jgi:serine/threonine kinase PknH